MRKNIILLSLLLISMAVNAAVNDRLQYFVSDFSNPTVQRPLCGWTCFGSGKVAKDTKLGLSDASLREYFPEGCAAYEMLEFKGLGNAPWSNSTFETGGAADEWLVSPEIDLTDSSKDIMLDFDVLSYGSTNECKFEVYVSTTGNTREDFTDKPVYSGRQKGSAREIVRSTVHKALKDMGGKKIWIAFVNKSTDAQLTGFTRIVLSEYDIDVVNEAPTFTTTAGSYEVKMQVSIMTPVSCRGFVARLEGSDGGMQEYSTDKQLNSRYNTYSFEFPDPISVEFGDKYGYTVTITPNYDGATPTVINSTLVCMEGYPATCVMEEGTGTWCGYCVRGTAAIKYYNETLGDRFIGIAVHSDDPMEVYDYHTRWAEQSGIKNYPSAWINRKIYGEPAMSHSEIIEYANRNVGQRITIDKVCFNPESNVATVIYSPEFCYDLPNADVTAVAIVTEDGCQGRGSSWSQSNNYSGYTLDEWLAEGLPESIWEYVYDYTEEGESIPSSVYPFDHVAMGIFNNYYGDNTTLATEWKAGEAQQYSMTFDFPMQTVSNESGVQNWRNTAVTMLLLDRATGEVLNADQMSASAYAVEGAGIQASATDNSSITRSDTGILVKSRKGAKVDIIGINGMVISSRVMASDIEEIESPSQNGIMIVRVTDGNDSIIKKIPF